MNKNSLRFKIMIITGITIILSCILLASTSIFASRRMLTSAALVAIPAEVARNIEATIEAIPLEVAAVQNKFDMTTIAMMAVIIGCSNVLIYYVLKKELAPLEFLTTHVEQINTHNIGVPIKTNSNTREIIMLENSINEMKERVNKAYVLQKNFSVNAAHELRTPLTVLKSNIEVFKMKKNRSIKEYEDLTDLVERNTSRLSTLVEELLELTHDEDVVMTEVINLRNIVDESILDLSKQIEKRNIHINIEGDKNITGNELLIQRMIFNLVENAIKYNEDNGYINIKIESINSDVKVSIFNTGNQIPNDFKETIFEPFVRVDNSRSREIGGSGLGLSIVKKIADKHNAIVEIENFETNGTLINIIFNEVTE